MVAESQHETAEIPDQAHSHMDPHNNTQEELQPKEARGTRISDKDSAENGTLPTSDTVAQNGDPNSWEGMTAPPSTEDELLQDDIQALKLKVTTQLPPSLLMTPTHRTTTEAPTQDAEASPQMESAIATRSSPRLREKPKKQHSTIKMAQQVLAKKLGILREEEELKTDTLQKYLDI